MMKQRVFIRSLGILLVLTGAVYIAGCATTPEEIPEDLSQMEMFQRGQEAVDERDWDLALRYYREFINRFPDDRGPVMEARYEIAFIAYKQEQYDDARDQFESILSAYEADQSGALPEWPRVLSQRLLEIIEERTAPPERDD